MKAFIALVTVAIFVIVVVALTAPPSEAETHEEAASATAHEDLQTASEPVKPARTPRLSPGAVAYDFALPLSSGETVQLSELRGNVVVIDFWATWCAPCMRVMPEFDRFARWAKKSGEPIKVFAVHTWERKPKDVTKEAVQSLWNRRDFETPVLFDFGGAVAKKFGVGGIPHTVVIGTDGRIVKQHTGLAPGTVEAVLRNEVMYALGEEWNSAASNAPEVIRATN